MDLVFSAWDKMKHQNYHDYKFLILPCKVENVGEREEFPAVEQNRLSQLDIGDDELEQIRARTKKNLEEVGDHDLSTKGKYV